MGHKVQFARADVSLAADGDLDEACRYGDQAVPHLRTVRKVAKTVSRPNGALMPPASGVPSASLW